MITCSHELPLPSSHPAASLHAEQLPRVLQCIKVAGEGVEWEGGSNRSLSVRPQGLVWHKLCADHVTSSACTCARQCMQKLCQLLAVCACCSHCACISLGTSPRTAHLTCLLLHETGLT